MSNSTTNDNIPSKIVKVAVVQATPIIFDTPATLQKLDNLCSKAASKGAQLVLFPEAFITFYPRGTAFGAVVGYRPPEGRELFRRYWESAVEIPGSVIDQLGAIASKYSIHLVVGVIEREGGTLYCTVVFFNDEGQFLGKHRKVMPTAAERLCWGYGDGSTLPVLDTKVGKIGAAICVENYMPGMRMAMYAKGVQIYCAPTVNNRDTWLPTMRHVAVEGRCFVLSCNQFVRKSDYPKDFPTIYDGKPDDFVVCSGGSCIVNPMGQVIAGPNNEGECILTAELDLNDIIRAKFDFDVVGHYSRPDLFKFIVNEEKMSPVLFTGNNEKDHNSQEKQTTV